MNSYLVFRIVYCFVWRLWEGYTSREERLVWEFRIEGWSKFLLDISCVISGISI